MDVGRQRGLMAYCKGGSDMRRYLGKLPAELEKKVLRGAAKAAAAVVADEARNTVASDEVREAIVTQSKFEPGRIVVKITVEKGFARSIGTWLEYGTKPHFITVDDSQRRGRSVSRINRQANEPDSNHSLVIGGQFVGATVLHPGARESPFLRPALDLKKAEAIAAAQTFINSRITPAGITGSDEPESEAA